MTREERNAIRSLKRLAKRWPKTIELHITGTGTISVIRPLDAAQVAAWEERDRAKARANGRDMSTYSATPEPERLATIRIPCSIGATG